MTNCHLIIPALALALVPAACGGSDKPSATTTTRPAAAEKPAAIPHELIGTWTTKLGKATCQRSSTWPTRSA